MQHTTSFATIWNGKIFPENFGTVRLHNPEKYYVGALHDIVVKDETIGQAKVMAVRQFAFNTIRDPLSWLDANMSSPQFAAMLRRMYDGKVSGGVKPDTIFDHVVMHWEKRDFKMHVKLMDQYYQKILDDGKFDEPVSE